MSGRRKWPWTESQRRILRKIKLWRRESKATAETNFERGKRVTYGEIARRLNEQGLLGPGGEWSAQAVARQYEKDDSSPVHQPAKKHLRPEEYLTYDQVKACKAACSPRDKLIFDFLLETGLRPGCEFAKLERRDLEFTLTGPVIHVREGKRKKKRFVAISQAISKKLQANCFGTGETDPMFLDTKGKALSARALRKRLAKLGHMAGVGHLYPYRLRHTFGTLLYDNGRDLLNVAEQMGHSDIKTTRIYAKVLDEAGSNQAEALHERLESTEPERECTITNPKPDSLSKPEREMDPRDPDKSDK